MVFDVVAKEPRNVNTLDAAFEVDDNMVCCMIAWLYDFYESEFHSHNLFFRTNYSGYIIHGIVPTVKIVFSPTETCSSLYCSRRTISCM